MKKTLFKALVATSLVASAGAAFAATSTSTMTVDGEVVASCSVTAGALNFGPIDPLKNATTATDASSTVDVTCSNGTAYKVGLNAGLNAGTGGVTARKMKISGTGTSVLNYAVYTDSTRTTNWDDIGGTTTPGATGSGASQSFTAYGRLPSGQQTAPVGTYSDSVTVTVSF